MVVRFDASFKTRLLTLVNRSAQVEGVIGSLLLSFALRVLDAGFLDVLLA